jgi:hypothetical protein
MQNAQRIPGQSGNELVDLAASRLAWNRLEQDFWFHYTDRAAARAIAATRTYRVSERHPKAPGLYVTSLQPGSCNSAELLDALFDGTRDIERTQAVVVLADAPLKFTRTDASVWCHQAPAGTELDLGDHLVGWAAKEGGKWLHSPTLYLP